MKEHKKKNKLGRKIATLRKHLGLSQLELSEITGITQVELSRYENDMVQPGIENILKLCKAFRVSPDNLLLGSF